MSLVNDMLNDLDERRRQQPANNDSLKWLTGRAPSKSQKRFLPFIISFFIVLLMISGYLIWKNQTAADDSADKLLSRPEIIASPRPLMVSSTEILASTSNDSSRFSGSPRDNAEHGADSLWQLEKELMQKQGSQVERVIDRKVEKISSVLPVDAAPEVLQKNILDKSKQDTVEGRKVAIVDARPVKKARPLTAEQLDRQAAKKANSLLKNNKLVAAEELLLSFLESQPIALASGQLLVSIWMSQKKFDSAEKLIDRLRLSRPRHVGLMIINARLLLLTKRANMAVEMLLSERPAIVMHATYYELLALAARQNEQYQLSE